MTYEEWQKQRRREQGRRKQTAYREHQHRIESRLMREIDTLKQEIKQLSGCLHDKQQIDPIHAVRNLYYPLECRLIQQQRPGVRKHERTYGCSPALQLLLDIQREEFGSMASLKLHWSWYRTQFRVFQFSVTSFERLELGGHVIIKVTGELRLDIFRHGNVYGGKKSGYGEIVCPVLHQFEFEKGDQAVTRITSEVDLICGVMASQGHGGLERALSGLHCLSDGFGL